MPVSSVEEVLEHALVSTLVPIEWDDEAEDDTRVSSSPAEDDEEQSRPRKALNRRIRGKSS